MDKNPPAGAPEGTLWFGGPLDWMSVRLLIKSKDVVPAWVTKQLGVEPTNSHIPNTPVTRPNGSAGPVRAEGWWSLTLCKEDAGEATLEEAAIQLLARLPVESEVWRSLPAQPHLIFSLGMPRANCGFDITPSLASLAVERNMILGFDIYGESVWAEH